MVKIEHFNYNGDFSPALYLTDIRPGKVISMDSDYVSVSRSISMDTFKDKLTEFGIPLKKLYNRHSVSADNDFVILLTTRGSTDNVHYVHFYWLDCFDSEKLKLFKEYIESVSKPLEGKKLPKFNLVTIGQNGPSTITKTLKKQIDIDVDNSYNLDIDIETIKSDIKDDTSGLMIFAGDPGTGKTTFIKYLAQEFPDKNFFFLSNSNLGLLSDPKFTTYCLDEMENAILVLEDCERAMLSRDINKSFDISNILNITDGIVGDMLNMKIIATLNTHDKIDSALLRKGRLIRKVEFKKLSPEQVANMANKLGKVIEPKEMALCEVYNSEDNGVEPVKKGAFGFVKD